MAITAWSANVWTRSICCRVNGSTATRARQYNPDWRPLAYERNAKGTAEAGELLCIVQGEFRIGQYVVDMNDFAFEDRSPIDRIRDRP